MSCNSEVNACRATSSNVSFQPSAACHWPLFLQYSPSIAIRGRAIHKVSFARGSPTIGTCSLIASARTHARNVTAPDFLSHHTSPHLHHLASRVCAPVAH